MRSEPMNTENINYMFMEHYMFYWNKNFCPMWLCGLHNGCQTGQVQTRGRRMRLQGKQDRSGPRYREPWECARVKGLSGSSACHWYIDEDLPVINDFHNRLGTDFKPIDNNGALVEGAFPTRVYADPIEMTVSDLLQLNPYENEEKRFICTVTVERLNPDQRWWFFSCSTCNKTSTMLAASQYRCTNPNCSTKDAQETYCLSLFARDDVAEAEFIMFDKVGKAAVGKPLLTLLKFRNPGLLTIQEIARVPMVDRIAPPEVTQVVGQKYKLLVPISKRSFATTSM